MSHPRQAKIIFVLLLLSTLAACGGGGGVVGKNDNPDAGNITGTPGDPGNAGNNTGNNPANADQIPPSVVSSDPTQDQNLTAAPTSIRVEFSEAMDPVSVKASFQLKRLKISLNGSNASAPGGVLPQVESEFVPVAVSDPVASNGNQTFEWQPVDPLFKGAFQFFINTAAKDLNQNPLGQDFKAEFKVTAEASGLGEAPAEAPTVVRFTPTDGTEKVERLIIPVVTFSQPMSVASVKVNFTLSHLKVGSGIQNIVEERVSGTVKACPGNKTFAFEPDSMLRRTERYRIRIGTGAQSSAGIPLADEADSDFETRSSIVGIGAQACP